ncbi:MAG: hypothetical protein ACYC2G_13545 [Gemmatimonadaceae bacterium]
MALLLPAPLAAQVTFGPQVGYAGGIGLGIGGRAGASLGSLFGAQEGFLSRLSGSAGLDYYFMDDAEASGIKVSQNFLEATALVTYPLPIESAAKFHVGGGLNLGRLSTKLEAGEQGEASVSDSEIGLNALAGVSFPQLALPVFVELRLSTLRMTYGSLDESSGLYLTTGFMFGGRH